MSTFQCLLRTDPAPLGVVVMLGSVLAARNGKARPWRFEPEQKVDGSTAQQFRAGSSGQVPGRSRLSAARNFRQGQGGSGVVYPLHLT